MVKLTIEVAEDKVAEALKAAYNKNSIDKDRMNRDTE